MLAGLSELLPYVGASAMAYVAYLLGQMLSRRFGKGAVKRMEGFSGIDLEERDRSPVIFGSQKHRLRLAFAQIGFNVSGWEDGALWLGRGALGLILFMVLTTLIGLPAGPSLIGFLAGILLMNGVLDGAWSKVRIAIEAEIPAFLNGFSSTIQVTQDVLRSIQEEAEALDPKGPLRAWLLQFVSEAQAQGYAILEEKLPEAFQISSSLGVVLFLIGRFWRTGGQEWGKSFALAAGNLEGVLDARIIARSTGESAKGSVKVVAGITVFVIVIMMRNQSFTETMQNPLVQLAYVLIALMMVFGMSILSNMIDNII